MFALVITEKGGENRRIVFNKPEVTIGRVQGNDIVLPKGNVSKRHARIVLKDGKFIIVDLKSTNGTYVNGRKITSPLVVKETDKIYIGDFIMGVEEDAAGESLPAPEAAESPSASAVAPPLPPAVPAGPPSLPSPPPSTSSPELLRAALQRQEPPRPQGSGESRPVVASTLPPPGPQLPPAPPGGFGAPGTDSRPRPPRPMPGTPSTPASASSSLPASASSSMSASASSSLPASASSSMSASASASVPAMAPPPASPPAPQPVPPTVFDPPRVPAPAAPAAPAVAASVPSASPPPAELAPAAPVMSSPARSGTGPHPSVAAPSAAGSSTPRPRLVGAGARLTSPPPVLSASDGLDPATVQMLALQARIGERLRPSIDLANGIVAGAEAWQRTERAVADLVEVLVAAGEVPGELDRDQLIKATVDEALGLGPLEELLNDDAIDEIVVDRSDSILAGRNGALNPTRRGFSSDESLRRVIDRMIVPSGTQLSESNPIVDVRLRDGSRLTAVVAPAAVHGPTLVLRKPKSGRRTLADLVATGGLSPAMADFLEVCVAARRNLVVCGSTGVGKTAVLSALVSAVRERERVISVEDVAELSFERRHWIALETRPATGANPAIDLAQLLRAALRLRPDRVVIGDLRGAEAFELAIALSSAVDGGLVAITGEGPHAALTRWAMLAQLSTPAATELAVRTLVAGAAHVAVHVARAADGQSRVIGIDEVVGVREGGFELQNLFSHHRGDFRPSGAVPRFWPELETRGVAAAATMFKA